MIRILRAFAWLRWRLFLNAFRGSRRRDMLERFSRAASAILPITLAVAFVPALLGFGALGILAGWLLGSGGEVSETVSVLMRVALGLVTVAVVVAPALRSTRGGTANLTRLLLLPIPRGFLHLAEMGGSLLDPWVAIIVPFALTVPVGLAAAGRPGAACAALLAGLAFLAILAALGATVNHALALLYRDRRRGEVVTLVVLLVLSLSGFIPALIGQSSEKDRKREGRVSSERQGQQAAGEATGGHTPAQPQGRSAETSLPAPESRPASGGQDADGVASPAGMSEPDGSAAAIDAPARMAAGEDPPPRNAPSTGSPSLRVGSYKVGPGSGPAPNERTHQPVDESGAGAEPRGARFPFYLRLAPSEMYATVLAVPAPGGRRTAAIALGGLLLLGAALCGMSWSLYRRLLDSPETASGRRSGRLATASFPRLPGLSASSSAVAHVYLRALLRTVHGKFAFWYTPVSLLLAALLISRIGDRESFAALKSGGAGGAGLVGLGAAVLLLGLHRMMFNQFGSDGSGLTLQLLSPIGERELIAGRAAAFAFLFGVPSLFLLLVGLVATPRTSPWLWGAVILGGSAGFLLVAPVAALLSALFPKAADLGRIGQGSQPSSVASFLGMFSTFLLVAPPAALIAASLGFMGSPRLAFVLVAAWAALAAVANRALSGLTARVVVSRRENLALVAQGR